MKIYRNVHNVEDVKDERGGWKVSYYQKSDIYYTTFHTRGGVLWRSVVNRTTEGSKEQILNPNYIGCQNLFNDCDSFIDWCHTQKGYFEKTDERYWSLDKDIILKGNKSYSQETCCFIPNYINCLFTNHLKKNSSESLMGVYWRERFQKYVSQCQNEIGKREHLGHFNTEFEAHQAWQIRKSEVMLNKAQEYLLTKSSRSDVYEAIVLRAKDILIDHKNGVPTLFV